MYIIQIVSKSKIKIKESKISEIYTVKKGINKNTREDLVRVCWPSRNNSHEL